MAMPLTVSDAARVLGCSERTIRKLCDRGLICYYRVPGSRHRRFHPHDMRSYLERHNLLECSAIERQTYGTQKRFRKDHTEPPPAPPV